MASPSRRRELGSRTALSMLVSAVLLTTFGVPGYANPSQVPDAGARPAPIGEVPLPDGSPARPPSPRETIEGPLAAEIAEAEFALESVTRQLKAITPEVGPAESAVDFAQENWQLAAERLETAQITLDDLVGESFRGAAALPPELFLPQLRGLSAHAPVPVEAPLGTQAAARELVKARDAEETAAELLASARTAEQTLVELADSLAAELAALEDQLADLHERNAEQLAAQVREREAAQQERAADRYPDLAPVAGFEAGDQALAAVRHALAQLGKPYQWGAQGPDRFDCSGLMWAAYRHVGVPLPRVAADQFWGTRDRLVTRSTAVAQRGLLPGDLVFFSSGPDWQSIHHVGMYVGNGQMVHAPNRNEVVKVSPVWWSRFFAATRVVEAVPTDDVTPPTSPPGAPTPDPTSSPTPSPTGGPSPTPPTGDPSPTPPTGNPSPTPPTGGPTPSPSPTPSPTPSPSPSPQDPTPSGSPDQPSPTPPPSPSPSPSSSPSSTPSATGSASPTPG